MSVLTNQITIDEISTVLLNARKKGLIDEDDTSVLFFDFSRLKKRLNYVKNSFPENFLHTVAIKTNPLIGFLNECIKADMGLEAASMGEVEIALASGAHPSNIVYDCPAKTIKELKKSIEYGLHINADNIEELKRLDKIIDGQIKNTIALRINPQIGSGKIEALSTAGEYSKFGVPIKYYKEEIIESFKRYPWLTGIHVHSGSQGMDISQMVEGIKIIYDLALEINTILKDSGYSNRINVLDIGGGFPIAYKENEIQCDMESYANDISLKCPNIFNMFKIITEFGRFYSAPIGWVASTVEYIKKQPGKNMAIMHVGADLFLRECYTPDNNHHKFSVLDAELKPKTENSSVWDIAGPLCFAGDIVGRNIITPEIHSGDYIIVHDAGANTINLWSRHCSRNVPKVIGYTSPNDFTVLRNKETYSDLIKFWGG
ncbi:MAG: diaminopimelate decarboxylase [Pseudomonadota bacterium]